MPAVHVRGALCDSHDMLIVSTPHPEASKGGMFQQSLGYRHADGPVVMGIALIRGYHVDTASMMECILIQLAVRPRALQGSPKVGLLSMFCNSRIA